MTLKGDNLISLTPNTVGSKFKKEKILFLILHISVKIK